MKIEGSTALVTGANRGIGRHLTRSLLDAGASKVYAGVRDTGTVTDPDVTAVRLDVTDRASVEAAAAELSDVTIVINNAGIGTAHPLLDAGVLDAARAEMEVNYIGLLSVSQAFAPVLAANGGGALANVLSVASWIASPNIPTYSASKSAAWSITHSLRIALKSQGTLVSGLHVGFVDTDLTAGLEIDKNDPRDVADAMVNGIAEDAEEIYADELSRNVKAALSQDLELLYPGVQETYDAQPA